MNNTIYYSITTSGLSVGSEIKVYESNKLIETIKYEEYTDGTGGGLPYTLYALNYNKKADNDDKLLITNNESNINSVEDLINLLNTSVNITTYLQTDFTTSDKIFESHIEKIDDNNYVISTNNKFCSYAILFIQLEDNSILGLKPALHYRDIYEAYLYENDAQNNYYMPLMLDFAGDDIENLRVYKDDVEVSTESNIYTFKDSYGSISQHTQFKLSLDLNSQAISDVYLSYVCDSHVKNSEGVAYEYLPYYKTVYVKRHFTMPWNSYLLRYSINKSVFTQDDKLVILIGELDYSTLEIGEVSASTYADGDFSNQVEFSSASLEFVDIAGIEGMGVLVPLDEVKDYIEIRYIVISSFMGQNVETPNLYIAQITD